MERRMTADGEIRIETRAGGKRTIIGYGAVFHREGDAGTEFRLNSRAVERIAPTAFERALREKQDVRGLFNHSRDHLLGRVSAGTMRLSADQRGLRYEIDLPDTQVGRDVAASIERGDLTGSSFGFQIAKDGENWSPPIEGQRVRTLVDVNLFDVGPVVFPAYDGTTTGVRDTSDVMEALASLAAWERQQVEARFAEIQATIGS